MATRALIVALAFAAGGLAQPPTDKAEPGAFEPIAPAVPLQNPPQNDRILGIIPNYLTVSDSARPVKPLTVKQKFHLFLRETADPFTLVSAGLGAALSQSGNSMPKYGVGAGPYGQRLGAAYADISTQNFFSDAVFASLFHQDPRYYRIGSGHSVARRTAYSLSRMFVTRQDSGRPAFNISGVLGTSLGIGFSNAYYPSCNVNGSTNGSRFITSVIAGSVSNLLPEFWPDMKQKLARHHHRQH